LPKSIIAVVFVSLAPATVEIASQLVAAKAGLPAGRIVVVTSATVPVLVGSAV